MSFIPPTFHFSNGRPQLITENSFEEGLITGIKVSRLTKILHLLFVDDVIIMSRASLIEWREINKLIFLFCKSSGLLVNQTKSTVHYEGLTDLELVPFKSLLPYTFSDLSLEFRYLGYFLKTGSHRAVDWDWLVSKLTKKLAYGATCGFHWEVDTFW
jgi:hypothetical protein